MALQRNMYRVGRLTAKPNYKTSAIGLTGIQPLHLDSKKDSFIYIPKSYNHNTPACLAMMLHGAGGNAEHGLSLLRNYADDKNIILLAPASQAYTWDIIAENTFGRDMILIDQGLAFVFDRFAINPLQIAIGGFSDGASYALCVGLSNGDLFTHIIAFSPGFFYTVQNQGKPNVFISHGVRDKVLPIHLCSRRIVHQLKSKNIKVHYHEFDGEHEIPAPISQAAIDGFTKDQ